MNLRACLNPRVPLTLAAVGVGGALFAPRLFAVALPSLALLACPAAMLAMRIAPVVQRREHPAPWAADPDSDRLHSDLKLTVDLVETEHRKARQSEHDNVAWLTLSLHLTLLNSLALDSCESRGASGVTDRTQSDQPHHDQRRRATKPEESDFGRRRVMQRQPIRNMSSVDECRPAVGLTDKSSGSLSRV